MVSLRLLVDTHAFFWAATKSTRLSHRAKRALGDPRNDLYISAATGWELATKHRIGRIANADGVVAGFDRVVGELGATTVPIEVNHALLAGSLDSDHRDPFDRILAAQALIEGLKLVTNDPAFDNFEASTYW